MVLNALEYPAPPSLASEKDSVPRRVKTQPTGSSLFFFQIHLGDYVQETMALTSQVNVLFHENLTRKEVTRKCMNQATHTLPTIYLGQGLCLLE